MSPADRESPTDRSYLDTPYVSVRWFGGGPWLVVEWKAWANSSEYRQAHETILVAFRRHRARRLLMDAAKARVISQEDQSWVAEDWTPRMLAAGCRWTAVVVPDKALMKTIVENIDTRIRDGSFVVGYFGTIDEARTWLSARR